MGKFDGDCGVPLKLVICSIVDAKNHIISAKNQTKDDFYSNHCTSSKDDI